MEAFLIYLLLHKLSTMPSRSDLINNYELFVFTCDSCGQEEDFTEEKIEKVKQKTPNTENDYYILCSNCKKGHMQQPGMIFSEDLFD